MIRLKLGIMFCLFFSAIQPIDQQLLMFLHTNSQEIGDEEGLNIAYQALTAIVQHAAPILMSENIWQHVVVRKDRFKQYLQDKNSMQSAVLSMHKKVNNLLITSKGDISFVNRSLDDAWCMQQYLPLSQLDQISYKHLLFDYFCYYVCDYFDNWKVYQLSGGYLLWIPYKRNDGFILKNLKIQSKSDIIKPFFSKQSCELDKVLQAYLSKDKSIEWSIYATGHGFHEDDQQNQAGVIGMTLQSFKKVLNFLQDTISTKLFVYSSCFGAGRHAIIPYQDENKDILLSYPVIVICLTDAPAYVFGTPSGLKLPPYNASHFLTSANANRQGLQPFFLQDFKAFCQYAIARRIDAIFAKTINPYVQCDSDRCTILKLENVPLIRRAYSSFFVPLDGFKLYPITNSSDQIIELDDKDACLWYVNTYPGMIKLSKKLPAFVSMIPGSQVHCGKELQAPNSDFSELVRALFLSIDDIQEQNIYLFDKVYCSCMIPEISSEKLYELEQVLFLPTGEWLPSFAQKDASCYVYAQSGARFFSFCFDQNKQISCVQELSSEQIMMLRSFKHLLLKECNFGNTSSISMRLSSQHFCEKNQLRKKLLQTCLQEKICK